MKLHRNRKNRKGIQKVISVAIALCLTVSTGSSYVSAETAEGNVQLHEHKEECYEKAYIDGSGEQGEDSYRTTLVCGYGDAELPTDADSGGEKLETEADINGTGTENTGANGSGTENTDAEGMGANGSGTESTDAEGTGTKESDADSDTDWADLRALEELPAEAAGAAMWLAALSPDEITDPGWNFYAYYVNQGDPWDVTLYENFNLKYQMEFHASRDFEAGDVVIKIDGELFKDRNGNSVLPTEIGIPQGTPDNHTVNRSTSFNYYYEDDGRTLVFFNYRKITSGTNAAWQVLYKDQKLMNIVDETDWALIPQISVDQGGTYDSVQELTGRVDSRVALESVEKSYYSKSGSNYTPGLYTLSQVQKYISANVDRKFLDADGRLDTANWHFTVWDVKVKGTATQPWDMVIEEIPGSEGVVVGYKDNSDEKTEYNLPIGTVAPDGTALKNQQEESWGNRFYVVTAYPAEYAQDGDKVSNDITIKLIPADGKDPDEELAAPAATWTYEDYDWHYSGNIIGVQKETDKSVYTGWLDAYRLSKVKGEDYGDMPFKTTGHMYGYSYTHRIISGNGEDGSVYTVGDYIPDTYYTLTTVDDFMYLYAGDGDGVIMEKGDYYFSGVTITQTDYGYNVWDDEKTGSELADVKDEYLPGVFSVGDEVKSAVRIYAMLANPSDGNRGKADQDGWVLIDTVYLDNAGRMEPYAFSDEIIAQEPWRVKAEHDTIDYETICTIEVKVRIKSDSSKMQAILEERENVETNEKSPEVKFENVSGVLGRVHQGGTITYLTDTDGNHGSANYSEPGLAEATKELYRNEKGEAMLLIRDNADRTVTWLNETAASFKNAKSTNDVDNNRVLVDYYLTAYDGYEIYSKDSLSYLREEDQDLISPGRSHVVFYDLLPYGMQFDASAPITAGRITNLSNNTYQTQPKSWDGTQVTVTVDPEKDIITNYRGTGRTMVAFHIAFSGADATSYTGGKWIEGWGVSFRAYYDWKDIDQLNEVEINANLCAFMPDFSELSGGSNMSHPALVGLKTEVDYDDGTHGDQGAILAEVDRAYADMVKEYTDGNGQTVKGNIDGYCLTDSEGRPFDTTYRNVLYAKNVLKDDVATSSQSAIEKLVRADSDRFGTFDKSAVVPTGTGREDDGLYTYDISVTTATGIKEIVIFDRLEQAAVDRRDTSNDPFAKEFGEGLITWSGTFQSLDTTGLDKQGISYTVYYNADERAQISEGDEDPNQILTVTKGWYTEEAFEEMLREKYSGSYTGKWQDYVKAVALRLDSKDGAAYQLNAGSSVSFRVHMKAPLVTELEDGSSLSTYNNASFSSVAVNTAERSTVIGNSVKVSISNEARLEIIKETSGLVPAAQQDESFEFRLYEEYEYAGETAKQYLAYTEYKLYKLSGEGNWELQDGLHATDGNGYLYLHAGEKAVFEVADAGRIQVKETENVFWESETAEQITEEEDSGKSVRILTVTNTYRPVLYMQKKLSAVPEGVDVSNESFTFKVEIKRNNNYIPLANAEFWYVDSIRLDGGIPGKISSGTTGADGTFTIKEGDIVALFPGVAGTEYRVSEVKDSEVNDDEGDDGDGEIEVPWNWTCEIDNVTGTMTAAGVSRSITNYYKWKDLLLTKDITHQSQEDYDAAPQPFTFRISEVGTGENGEEILIPMAGKEWELLGDGVNRNATAADEAGNENENSGATDEAGNENAAADGGNESGERTYETSGTLNENGEFTCTMGFRTVIIKGLEAGKTYRIEELTEGIGTENGKPLYIPADEGKVDTTMPVYSTRRDVTITNDYQKRPLTVKKTVAGSNDGENSGESSKTEYFRFTVTVNGAFLPQGTPYTVTGTASGETVTRYVGVMPEGENGSFAQDDIIGLAGNQFVLTDGETAVFKDAGMLGDEIVVTEVDNANQIYPADKGAYEDTFSGDGAEASFVNGKPGSLMIRKEYMGLDETGRSAVDFLREYGTWIARMEGGGDNGSVEFILTITDEEGSYVWPEMPVTVECIEKDGTIGVRNYEPGDSITVEPWVTIIIPTGEGTSIPSNATYTLIETEESRNKIIKYIDNGMMMLGMEDTPNRGGDYWMQISQSSASDALGKPETVIARPSATICNEVSSIGQEEDGSIRGKVMTSASEEVPEGKKLVWRVERYDSGSGAWSPAEGVSYLIFRNKGDEKQPVSKEVEVTEADGRITLYKPESGFYPLVWFPEDIVYLNLYAQADIDNLLRWQEEGKALLRLVEVLEESDDEWGMLAGYQGGGTQLLGADLGLPAFAVRASVVLNGLAGQQRAALGGSNSDGGMGSDDNWGLISGSDYSLDIPPMYAENFVNSNSKTSLEIEKYMAGSSDTLFTMILEQVVSTSSDGYYTPITKDDYQDRIIATKPGAGIPYLVHNADGSIAGSSVTGSGGEIQLEAGQYASLEVSDGTMWLVSEKTAATPNYRLKDLQPESGDVRLTKLNDNLMLITLPEKKLTMQYRVEWYLVDGTLLDSETRVGYVGERVVVTESDIAFRKNEGYEYLMYDRRGITAKTLAVNSDNTLKLYFDQIPQEVSYTVEWYDIEGNSLKAPELRSGTDGEFVSVTEVDKHIGDNYVYDTEDKRNVEVIELTSGGENVLRLYFKKKVTVEYTVKYTDGVLGVNVFSDVVKEGLHEGDPTPEFEGGEPTREGYEFMGWSPAVAPIVSGEDANKDSEIVYTATWRRNDGKEDRNFSETGEIPE